jgi:hypothetical protein
MALAFNLIWFGQSHGVTQKAIGLTIQFVAVTVLFYTLCFLTKQAPKIQTQRLVDLSLTVSLWLQGRYLQTSQAEPTLHGNGKQEALLSLTLLAQ